MLLCVDFHQYFSIDYSAAVRAISLMGLSSPVRLLIHRLCLFVCVSVCLSVLPKHFDE